MTNAMMVAIVAIVVSGLGTAVASLISLTVFQKFREATATAERLSQRLAEVEAYVAMLEHVVRLHNIPAPRPPWHS